MEKVVYMLGAGFSAPMGLPVISNFRFKSQDMFLEDPARYSHFQEVFDAIGEMSVSKNYYQTDLFNIEEILSILEMNDYLQGDRLKPVFIQYIKDVLSHYTPAMREYTAPMPGNWEVTLFGSHQKWRLYGQFVASLLNLIYESKPLVRPIDPTATQIHVSLAPQPQTLYGIVTLNYDLIPESVWEFTKEHFATRVTDGFSSDPQGPVFAADKPVKIAKLHGSLDSDVIVPPTWSKGVSTAIVPAWSLAKKLLAEATQIRVIGFSLPVADAYVKYLLKAAAIQNRYLKRLDVICMDPGGATRRRYDDFVQFGSYRFADADTTDYLTANITANDQAQTRRMMDGGGKDRNTRLFDQIETAHEAFMQQNAK